MVRSASITFLFLTVFLTLHPQYAIAKKLKPYQPSDLLEHYRQAHASINDVNNKMIRHRVRPNWIEGDNKFWYKLDLHGNKREWVVVDCLAGTRQLAFDHTAVGKQLSELLQKDVDGSKLNISDLQFDKDLTYCEFKFENSRYRFKYKDKQLEKLAQFLTPPNIVTTSTLITQKEAEIPRWEFAIKDHNAVLVDNENKQEYLLTTDGTVDTPYQFNKWSPTRKHVAFMKVQPGDLSQVHLLESSPKDSIKAKLHTRTYAQPGDRFDSFKLFIASTETQKSYAVDADIIDYHGPPRLQWHENNDFFTYQKDDRGHQRVRVIAVSAADGTTRTIIDEKTDTFINQIKFFRHYTKDGKRLVWASERSDWNHLYLYDLHSGQRIIPITSGEWAVKKVHSVHEKEGYLIFSAVGTESDEDPYHEHYFRVNLDGSNLTKLTDGDGTHKIQLSPTRRFLIDEYSRIDQPPIHTLRNATTGKVICRLEIADISQLVELGFNLPERFVAKGRDGKTNIYGMVYRPRIFDPKFSYPVVEYIYAGPHDSHVPKSFMTRMRMFHLAELGFITVMVDGMGTDNRGKDFHDVCWKNLQDSGLPDHITWLKALNAKYPHCDISNLGIFGTSAGGQSSTAALLHHSDFYRVAVSSCGCHDNRVDKHWWNEQWMGYPIEEHYKNQSNTTNANLLKGNLLLMVGEMDTNVPPESTYQLVNALIKSKKEFDLLVVPGMGHSSGGEYGQRRRWDYFVRHLHGLTPPNWNEHGYPPK
ncbi:MAG: prolyl oligopeptidase family serine peptidase [Pirellulales bacterium]|nr:prolyl oligopeptidase family serine peptidase [Pirellulales bacterium]